MGDPGVGGGGGAGRHVSHLPGQQRPDDLDASIRPHVHPHAASARLRPLLQNLQRLRGGSGLRGGHAVEGAVRGAAAGDTGNHPIPRMHFGKWCLHPAFPNQNHLHAVCCGGHLVVLLPVVCALQQRPDS